MAVREKASESRAADAAVKRGGRYGMDFTSYPGKRKRITREHCVLEGDVLPAMAPTALITFEGFEEALSLRGPWIAASTSLSARRGYSSRRWAGRRSGKTTSARNENE